MLSRFWFCTFAVSGFLQLADSSLIYHTEAQLHNTSEKITDSALQALIVYLRGYLSLLENAGYHTLFCLPSFNKDGFSYTIDYSLAIKKFTDVDLVHGISVQKINDFLLGSWRNAILLSGTSDELCCDGEGLALVEYRSRWSPRNFGLNFEIFFSAPRVHALCGQEVIIEFTIDTLSFFNSLDVHW